MQRSRARRSAPPRPALAAARSSSRGSSPLTRRDVRRGLPAETGAVRPPRALSVTRLPAAGKELRHVRFSTLAAGPVRAGGRRLYSDLDKREQERGNGGP